MAESTHPLIVIGCGELFAEIDPQGAQLCVFRTRDGQDLLWNGDPAFWTGRAPLLFPIVGALNGGSYRIGGKSYHLPRHGFARTKPFALQARTSSSATFRLSADAVTLAVYPFQFDLDVSYQLTGATLSVTAIVHNRGAGEMLASFGYHPAFRWPLPFGQTRESHWLRFESDEPAEIRRLDAAGLLRPEAYPTPIVNGKLALTDALFRDDVLILDRFQSRALAYGSNLGPRLRVDYPDARYVGLWTKPGAPFVCIEPWRGVADPQGFTGDFTQKPGIVALAVGESFASTMRVTLEA